MAVTWTSHSSSLAPEGSSETNEILELLKGFEKLMRKENLQEVYDDVEKHLSYGEICILEPHNGQYNCYAKNMSRTFGSLSKNDGSHFLMKRGFKGAINPFTNKAPSSGGHTDIQPLDTSTTFAFIKDKRGNISAYHMI